jgi:hypothetical protein
MNKWIASIAIATFTAAVAPAFGADPVVSDSTPVDATVKLSGGAVAAGIGYTWGNGNLTVGNRSYTFSISGLSIVDVGASSYSASGNVYHLGKLSDFDGNYVAFSAGATLAGGGNAVYLRNQNGVVIKVVATEVGLRFNLATSGVDIALNH